MTQDQWIILWLKVAELAAIASIAGFTACYSWWAPWWRNQIGRTIVVKDLLLIVALLPASLSLFFHFSRLTSRVAAWADIAMIGLIAPVMIWRVWVFRKLHRDGERKRDAGGP